MTADEVTKTGDAAIEETGVSPDRFVRMPRFFNDNGPCYILLNNDSFPHELKLQIAEWVDYYNNHRCHESLGNSTPADKYEGREGQIIKERRRIKEKTLRFAEEVERIYDEASWKAACGTGWLNGSVVSRFEPSVRII